MLQLHRVDGPRPPRRLSVWRKAVELRKLAIERQTLTEAIDDFKVIMNEQKRQADTEKFLNEVLRGTPAEQPAARAGDQD